MARLDQTTLTARAVESLGGTPDPTGEADLVFDRGKVVVVADPAELRAAFARLKRIDGLRWIVVNREDLFAANPLSIGTKVGIIDETGSILKAADVPRRIV